MVLGIKAHELSYKTILKMLDRVPVINAVALVTGNMSLPCYIFFGGVKI